MSCAGDGAENESSASSRPTTAPAATAPPPTIARWSMFALVVLAAGVGCTCASFSGDRAGLAKRYFQFLLETKHEHTTGLAWHGLGITAWEALYGRLRIRASRRHRSRRDHRRDLSRHAERIRTTPRSPRRQAAVVAVPPRPAAEGSGGHAGTPDATTSPVDLGAHRGFGTWNRIGQPAHFLVAVARHRRRGRRAPRGDRRPGAPTPLPPAGGATGGRRRGATTGSHGRESRSAWRFPATRGASTAVRPAAHAGHAAPSGALRDGERPRLREHRPHVA